MTAQQSESIWRAPTSAKWPTTAASSRRLLRPQPEVDLLDRTRRTGGGVEDVNIVGGRPQGEHDSRCVARRQAPATMAAGAVGMAQAADRRHARG